MERVPCRKSVKMKLHVKFKKELKVTNQSYNIYQISKEVSVEICVSANSRSVKMAECDRPYIYDFLVCVLFLYYFILRRMLVLFTSLLVLA